MNRADKATYSEGGRRAQAFVMVLGYSRAPYVEFTADQRLETLLRCHEHAFDWLGGVTNESIYDNPRTVVLRRNADGTQIERHRRFVDVSNACEQRPRPGRRRPHSTQSRHNYRHDGLLGVWDIVV